MYIRICMQDCTDLRGLHESVHKYIHIYVHACRVGPPVTYIHTYTYMHAEVVPRPHICIYTRDVAPGHIYIYIHVCIYIHIHIYTYMHAGVGTRVGLGHIFIYTPWVGPRSHIHIYTYIYTYVHTCMPGWDPGHIYTYT